MGNDKERRNVQDVEGPRPASPRQALMAASPLVALAAPVVASKYWRADLFGHPDWTQLPKGSTRELLECTLGRGGGGEPFALERAGDYYENVLPKVSLHSYRNLKFSSKLGLSTEDAVARGDALALTVVERLVRIANGKDRFCGYCGKDKIKTVCARCKKVYFCASCQKMGWKYHKVWCSEPCA